MRTDLHSFEAIDEATNLRIYFHESLDLPLMVAEGQIVRLEGVSYRVKSVERNTSPGLMELKTLHIRVVVSLT